MPIALVAPVTIAPARKAERLAPEGSVGGKLLAGEVEVDPLRPAHRTRDVADQQTDDHDPAHERDDLPAIIGGCRSS